MTNNKFEGSKKVVKAVQEMNSVTGSIGLHTDMLDDISSKLFQVVDDMNNAAHNGKEMVYYREHHHELRLLAQLMHYAMIDVKRDTEEIISLGENLHEEIIRKS